MPLRTLLISSSVLFALPPALLLSAQDQALAIGISQAREGDFDQAILTLDGVARRLKAQGGSAKDLARAHVFLAVAHLGLGRQTDARTNAEAALRLHPALQVTVKEFPPRVVALFDEVHRTMPAPTPATAPAATPIRTANTAAGQQASPATLATPAPHAIPTTVTAQPQMPTATPAPAPTPAAAPSSPPQTAGPVATPVTTAAKASNPPQSGGGHKGLWIGLGAAVVGGGAAAAIAGRGTAPKSEAASPTPTPTPTPGPLLALRLVSTSICDSGTYHFSPDYPSLYIWLRFEFTANRDVPAPVVWRLVLMSGTQECLATRSDRSTREDAPSGSSYVGGTAARYETSAAWNLLPGGGRPTCGLLFTTDNLVLTVDGAGSATVACRTTFQSNRAW